MKATLKDRVIAESDDIVTSPTASAASAVRRASNSDTKASWDSLP